MPESKDDELSMDELKDVSGGTNWDLPDTSSGVNKNIKGEKWGPDPDNRFIGNPYPDTGGYDWFNKEKKSSNKEKG